MEGADLCREGRDVETTTGTAANRYISVEGDIDFSGATFEGSADFKHAYFHSATTFNGASFDDVAMFNYATFDDQLELWATFSGKADFSKVTVRGSAQLRGTYETAAIFNYARFDGDVVLWNSTFGGKAKFLATTFGGGLDCGYATFGGLVRFCETTFCDRVELSDATFADDIRLRKVRAPNTVVDLRGARLTAGRIGIDDDESHFDLSDATIGEISVDVSDETELGTSPLDYLRIWNTNFDGFDFSRHASALKPGWQLHRTAESWPETSGMPTADPLRRFEALEDTYLRAKSGATDVGHNKAASEFFVHEMRYRRKQHASIVRRRISRALRGDASTVLEYAFAPIAGLGRSIVDVTRAVVPGTSEVARKREETPAWLAGYRWFSNGTLALVAGYGERPKRPLVASMLTIVVFAVGYRILAVTPITGTSSGAGYLLLSLQSFTTFILGSTPVNTGFLPQLLSSIEGFIGAFLIAVFVFTLTRSIHR